MYKIQNYFLLLFIFQFLFIYDIKLSAETSNLILPDIKGLSLKEKPSFYTEANLYEYINGAADLYLNYKFKKLTVIEYKDKFKGAITVDIYEHENLSNGFGIYCSEKPADDNFLKIGTEGYYEKGILNFYKGKYYVKIASFGIKENEKNILINLAKNISNQLKVKIGNPKILNSFPDKHKIKNSEKYISMNFLGHSFLHSAFTVDYSLDGISYSIFIIETDTQIQTKNILENYMSFLKKKGVVIETNNDILNFIDPYYKRKGKLFIKFNNNHLWGLFSKDNKKAESLINLIDSRLKKI